MNETSGPRNNNPPTGESRRHVYSKEGDQLAREVGLGPDGYDHASVEDPTLARAQSDGGINGDNGPENSSMRIMRPQYNNSLPIRFRRASDGGTSPDVKVRIQDTNNKNEPATLKSGGFTVSQAQLAPATEVSEFNRVQNFKK